MTDPERHDWKRIISEIVAGYLQRHGRTLSLNKLGLTVGLDHSSIRRLLEHPDAEPKHLPGEKLLAMHREYSRVSTLSSSDAPGT